MTASPTAPAPFGSIDDPGMADVSPEADVANEEDEAVVVPARLVELEAAAAPPRPGSPVGIFGMLREGEMDAPAAPTLFSILPIEMLMEPLAMFRGRPEAESTWSSSFRAFWKVFIS